MFTRTLKTVAVAAVVVVATAGASLAATYAYVDNDAQVHKNHGFVSPVVNQIWEGQQVKVVAEWKSWVKVQIPGKDGWVKKGNLDFNNFPNNNWPNNYNGGSFCINGQQASFCISGSY
jgi:hypothetical protein